jgi:hypothetical protein
MDLQGKPMYGMASCPLCKERYEFRAKAEGKPVCDRCGLCPLPAYENAAWGFEECSFTHWHLTKLGNVDAGEPVKDVLCWECYLADYEQVYEGQKVNIPQPTRILEKSPVLVQPVPQTVEELATPAD